MGYFSIHYNDINPMHSQPGPGGTTIVQHRKGQLIIHWSMTGIKLFGKQIVSGFNLHDRINYQNEDL